MVNCYMNNNLNRRDFIRITTGMGVCGLISVLNPTIVRATQSSFNKDEKKNVLKGFIITDTHFGLVNPCQPSVEQQREAMKVIRRRFVDLDVFIDTGDSCHNGLNKSAERIAKRDWTKIISNDCGRIPFYQTPGNHDVIHGSKSDPEEENNKITNMTCRPYYSFDIKNIHFVSLPELIRDIYITEETMAWLKLDLELNKDKTIIFISHNSIKGTSASDREAAEPGEFGVINSDQLKDIFAKYPKIIGWMHGHTHRYNIVKQNNMLHVSCGILGPDFFGGEQKGIGGVYFEIHPDKFIIRCFSASANKFHDEIGFASLSKKLAVKTSINNLAKPAYSYGIGEMNDGQKISLYNHHSSIGESDLYVIAGKTSEINDDPNFYLYEERIVKKVGKSWMLMGASVGNLKFLQAENNVWKWENPGIRLLKQNDSSEIDVCIPSAPIGKSICYRCAPNMKYKASITVKSSGGGQKCMLQLELRDKDGGFLKILKSPEFTLKIGKHTYSKNFFIPNPSEISNIYTTLLSDNTLQLLAKAKFTGINEEIIINNFNFKSLKPANAAENPEIIINNKLYKHSGNINSTKPLKLGTISINDARNVLQCNVGGKRKLSWLIRQKNIDWQVRNASVSDKRNYLEIKSMRNTYSPENEVVIVPTQPMKGAYVYNIQNIEHCRIYPLNRGNRKLKIEVIDCNNKGKMKVYCDLKPIDVEGALNWKYVEKNILININRPANIIITT